MKRELYAIRHARIHRQLRDEVTRDEIERLEDKTLRHRKLSEQFRLTGATA